MKDDSPYFGKNYKDEDEEEDEEYYKKRKEEELQAEEISFMHKQVLAVKKLELDQISHEIDEIIEGRSKKSPHSLASHSSV